MHFNISLLIHLNKTWIILLINLTCGSSNSEFNWTYASQLIKSISIGPWNYIHNGVYQSIIFSNFQGVESAICCIFYNMFLISRFEQSPNCNNIITCRTYEHASSRGQKCPGVNISQAPKRLEGKKTADEFVSCCWWTKETLESILGLYCEKNDVKLQIRNNLRKKKAKQYFWYEKNLLF